MATETRTLGPLDDLLKAAQDGLRALEAHLDESCRDHNLKHRDDLCPCNQNEVAALRAAIAKATSQPKVKRTRAERARILRQIGTAKYDRDVTL